jgi:hypothetical protein
MRRAGERTGNGKATAPARIVLWLSLGWLCIGRLWVGSPVYAQSTMNAVAATSNSGVAVGQGLILFSSTVHLAWFRAAGFDSTLNYTAAVWAGAAYLVGAEDGSVWQSVNPSGNRFTRQGSVGPQAIRSMAVIGAWVVAVGDNGMISRSSDLTGSSWIAQPSPVVANLRAVASNDLFLVAVGDGGVFLRGGVQGTGWTRVTGPGENRALLGLIGQPAGLFLAFGAAGAMWRGEPSGLTWTPITSPTTTTLRGGAVVGTTTVLVGDAGLIYYSPGGYTGWLPTNSPTTNALRAAVWTLGDVVAVGDQRTILWSSRGVNWMPALVPVESTTWGGIKNRFHSAR